MIRPLTEQDLPQVIKIESACQPVPWSDDVFKNCMEAGSSGWVVEFEDQVVGFILTIVQFDEIHILNFCVHPDHQHRGLGRKLMTHMLDTIKNQGGKFVYLEVRRSNYRAIALYENAGFSKVGERKDYYITLDQCEDALVFAKDLLAE